MRLHLAIVARLIAFVAVAAGAVVFAMPAPTGVPPEALKALGIVVAAIGLWSTAVVPVYVTSIIFFLAAVVAEVGPADVIFSGFHSSAVWLVFGGLVIAAAVQRTGLGARAARIFTGRPQGSYLRIVASCVALSLGLAFLVPAAVGRIIILLPIMLAVADRLGFAPGRPGRTGIALAVGAGTLIPAFTILPSNVPNMALAGAAESIYGISFTYSEFLLVNFTVMGVLVALALPVLITVLFRDAPAPAAAEEYAPSTTWSTPEVRLLIYLLAALGLWITDFVHGVSPAWVALAAALLCLLPRVGVVPPQAMIDDVNYAPWFFVAGIIGMGSLVTHTGLGTLIGRQLFAIVELTPGRDLHNFAAVFGIGAGVGVLTTLPGAPGVMTPLASAIAEATGWPISTVLMAQVPTWVVFALPYQAPPIILTLMLADVRMADAFKLILSLALFGVIVILPLQYLWWRLLGLIG